jgi:hypothetical protein
MKKSVLIAALIAGASVTTVIAHEGKGPGRMVERLRAADTNGDGLISRAEAAALPRLAEHFDALDANRDGQVSTEEMRAAHGKRGGGMFKHADADADGRVSQQEFLARAAGRFQKLDANGDGFLTQEEAQSGRRGHRGH